MAAPVVGRGARTGPRPRALRCFAARRRVLPPRGTRKSTRCEGLRDLGPAARGAGCLGRRRHRYGRRPALENHPQKDAIKKWGRTLLWPSPTRGRGLLVKARSWLRRDRRVDDHGRVRGFAGGRARRPWTMALVGRLAVAPVLGIGVGIGAAVASDASLGLAVVR